MSLELIEGAVDAIKDYLDSNMAAKLDELDTEYGDFALDDIKAYYVAEVSEIPEYPAVFVLGDNTTLPVKDDEGWMTTVHAISVTVFAGDQDTAQLRRKAYRYIRAVVELLKSVRTTVGGNVKDIEFNELLFSGVYSQADGYISAGRLSLSALTYELT